MSRVTALLLRQRSDLFQTVDGCGYRFRIRPPLTVAKHRDQVWNTRRPGNRQRSLELSDQHCMTRPVDESVGEKIRTVVCVTHRYRQPVIPNYTPIARLQEIETREADPLRSNA